MLFQCQSNGMKETRCDGMVVAVVLVVAHTVKELESLENADRPIDCWSGNAD
jgi:hypothetical protein